MYFFSNVTIKSSEGPRWYHSTIFISIWPLSCLMNCLLWLWKPYCICLEQNSIGKRPKDFEASGFPSCILNNTHFFWNQSQKSYKFHDVRKSGGVQQTRLYIYKKYFFIMRVSYTKLQSYSLCYRQTKWFMQKIPSATGIICARCKNYSICM